jgi:GR25 family glycosyltransferase involved in LPS biosynthesis
MTLISNTYVINLRDDKTRLDTFREEWVTKSGLKKDFIRIEAVNGNDLTGEQKGLLCTWWCKTFCNNSKIGCAMSHIKTWESVRDNNDEFALILEDDTRFQSNFKEELKKKLNSVPKDFDILYIGCFIGCDTEGKKNLLHNIHSISYSGLKYKKINNDIYVPSLPFGLHSYIVSKKGVNKLLSLIKINKLNGSIDGHILKYSSSLNIYATNPLLTYQNVNDSHNTPTYPVLINKLFNGYQTEYKVPFSYYLGSTHFEFFGIPFNFYLIILLILVLTLNNDGFKKFQLFYLMYNIIELITIRNFQCIPLIFKIYVLLFLTRNAISVVFR